MNDKINGRADVERMAKAPILGEIGHSDQSDTLVVSKNSRKFIAEQFRIIRTNLKYILNKIERPVILITSSFSGEGKSFISTNIGAVIALTGKKTVILEFDIRKPKIVAGLDLNRKSGITNYIVGTADIEDMVIPITQVQNLYVIPCGPVPPNPAELLLDEKVKELFKYLRERFDVIIVDSAPVGLVTDAEILSLHADATLYIMRQNYTSKKQIVLINELYNQNKLPKLSLILNDCTQTIGQRTYGGYGYGYGYGSGYFEQEGKVKKTIWQRIKSIFTGN
jgi:capsular exopolysaccharide synthesis family protein